MALHSFKVLPMSFSFAILSFQMHACILLVFYTMLRMASYCANGFNISFIIFLNKDNIVFV